MVVGDKVRVTKKGAHCLDVGEEVIIVEVDYKGNPRYNTVKVKDNDNYEWWLWEGEFELLNQE